MNSIGIQNQSNNEQININPATVDFQNKKQLLIRIHRNLSWQVARINYITLDITH